MNAGRWWLLGGLGVLAIVSLGIWASRPPRPAPSQSQSTVAAPSFPLPPISESPFLNTKPGVEYVGSEACQACHAEHDAAFRHTSMGRSMAEVDLSREPPDGGFDHPLSKHRYEVRRHDGQMWHRELLLADDSEQVVLAEFPVKYVVGSGHHSLTYLVEVDGFLVESPVTWYTSRKAWGMSPGYDLPEHSGFERAVGEGCLTCHASRAEALDRSLHRMHVAEAAIGCERCHGPGALHVAQYRDRHAEASASSRDIDHTIVNPAHLSRELGEAICQQCHLRSSATIPARGRQIDDFRPGLPLQDFRQDFWLDTPDKPMTVVGHVEQLHLSRCFQKSDNLTCLTCHHPHDVSPDEQPQPSHAICLTCHDRERCRVDEPRRQRESPTNDCVHCHMPRSDTDIPHLAFTHHRIGVHSPAEPSTTARRSTRPGTGALRPFLETSWPNDIEQQRSFGLGFLEVANREPDPALADEYRQRALVLLTNALVAGMNDPVLDASLARLRFDLELEGVESLAKNALSHAELVGQDRCNALFLLADAHFRENRPQDAIDVLHQLTTLRRQHVDWLLLADCEQKRGNAAAQKEALLTATRINPRLRQVHQHLAERFREEGNREQADFHQRRAAP